MQRELQSNSGSMSTDEMSIREIRLDELKQQFISWLLSVET